MSMKHPTVVYAEIDSFPLYKVGTDGSVWSRMSRNGRGGASSKWRKLAVCIGCNGYQVFVLTNGSGKRTMSGHGIVASAFIGDRPEGMEVCHNNGVKSDNRLANLRYDTKSGNQSDRERHGTNHVNQGGCHPMSKLSEETVASIRRDYDSKKLTQKELSATHGISIATVSDIVTRKTWSHI